MVRYEPAVAGSTRRSRMRKPVGRGAEHPGVQALEPAPARVERELTTGKALHVPVSAASRGRWPAPSDIHPWHQRSSRMAVRKPRRRW